MRNENSWMPECRTCDYNFDKDCQEGCMRIKAEEELKELENEGIK